MTSHLNVTCVTPSSHFCHPPAVNQQWLICSASDVIYELFLSENVNKDFLKNNLS
jgi:hypothetical protein